MKKTSGGQNNFFGDVTKDVGGPSQLFCRATKNPGRQKKSFRDMNKCFCDAPRGFCDAAPVFFLREKMIFRPPSVAGRGRFGGAPARPVLLDAVWADGCTAVVGPRRVGLSLPCPVNGPKRVPKAHAKRLRPPERGLSL